MVSNLEMSEVHRTNALIASNLVSVWDLVKFDLVVYLLIDDSNDDFHRLFAILVIQSFAL